MAKIMKPVSMGAFAYIGYAVGAILFVIVSGAAVDTEAAAGDLEPQLMFVVAFVVHVTAIVLVSRPWMKNKLSIWLAFALFWVIDALVPFIYQLLGLWRVFLPGDAVAGPPPGGDHRVHDAPQLQATRKRRIKTVRRDR